MSPASSAAPSALDPGQGKPRIRVVPPHVRRLAPEAPEVPEVTAAEPAPGIAPADPAPQAAAQGGGPGRLLSSWFDPRVAQLREGGEKIVHCAGLGDIDTGPLGDLDECAGQAVQFQGLAGQPVLQH